MSEDTYAFLRSKELDAAIAWVIAAAKARKPLIHNGRKPTIPHRSRR